MKTILDEGHTWFLHSLIRNNKLQIILIEGVEGETSDIVLNDKNLGPATQIEVNNESKKVLITFDGIIAFEVVDESYDSIDKIAKSDDNSFIRIMQSSRYLSYIDNNHGLYKHLTDGAKHYKIWTSDDIIDVISCEPPTIERID